MKVLWEQIDSDHAGYLNRARVPWGWLVMSTQDVYRIYGDSVLPQPGYEWRTSITFVFDPFHWWR